MVADYPGAAALRRRDQAAGDADAREDGGDGPGRRAVDAEAEEELLHERQFQRRQEREEELTRLRDHLRRLEG